MKCQIHRLNKMLGTSYRRCNRDDIIVSIRMKHGKIFEDVPICFKHWLLINQRDLEWSTQS